jgi:hypothetical protein
VTWKPTEVKSCRQASLVVGRQALRRPASNCPTQDLGHARPPARSCRLPARGFNSRVDAASPTISGRTAAAADWPAFKRGNWTFDRTMTGEGAAAKKVSTSKCTDPTADQKAQRAMLAKAGCQFTPLTQSGTTYRYSAICKMAGMTTTSDSVLEVESAEGYTITVDSTSDGSKTHEVLHARRTGDCPSRSSCWWRLPSPRLTSHSCAGRHNDALPPRIRRERRDHGSRSILSLRT